MMLRDCDAAAKAVGKHPIEVNIKPSMDNVPLLRTMGSAVDVEDHLSRHAAEAFLLAIT